MSTINLIIKFIKGAIAVLDKAIKREDDKAASLRDAAMAARAQAAVFDQQAAIAGVQVMQAQAMRNKLTDLIKE